MTKEFYRYLPVSPIIIYLNKYAYDIIDNKVLRTLQFLKQNLYDSTNTWHKYSTISFSQLTMYSMRHYSCPTTLLRRQRHAIGPSLVQNNYVKIRIWARYSKCNICFTCTFLWNVDQSNIKISIKNSCFDFINLVTMGISVFIIFFK